MSIPYGCILVVLLSIVVCNSAFAIPKIIPQPPSVAARGYIVQDFNSGYVIAEKNADTRLEPASLTKLMTALVIFEKLREGEIVLDEPVMISEKAWRMQGSRMFVEVNKQVSIEKLLKGLIIQSGNDASVALAEHVAGSEEGFVTMMNGYASEFGMEGTHFMNSTGLPDENHYTTARDMAKLTQKIIERFPEYYSWYSIKEYSYGGIKQFNRNKLLWRDKSVDGLKTGHTKSAGYCLITSAKRNGMRLISVVIGAKSEEGRAQESQRLLNYSFRFFETRKLYSANEVLTTTKVWKGETEELQLGVGRDFYLTFPRGRYKNLDASMSVDNLVYAPVKRGQELGSVNIKLNDQELGSQPLIALNGVEEGGFFQRMVDEVYLMFE
ncbi:MAG TPA: D-alanyl-D-alanine carboxypeptidase [Gammaproteobacteria bacterium]|nr:D-alanyl-D-alanine carboxypeptidase [Gammaproteobacteria bacterium]